MARIAFYAPLKSPHHPVPSGERQIARNLMQALTNDGYEPVLVSEFRPFDKAGDMAMQSALLTEAEDECARLIARGRAEAWQAFVTYHNYYKAPDMLGPAVSAALRIPYLSIEATRADKRLDGPWRTFERKAQDACDAADVLFHFTERDAVALRAALKPGQRLVHLSPFLARECLPEAAVPKGQTILSVGMMRQGDKLESYRIIAESLAHLGETDWTLEIAGDGPARQAVADMMAPFGSRVRFLGQLDAEGMAQAYRRARVFFWPGVNEAFGMVYLEAQAQGVPVVAQDRPGVREVVAAGGLVPAAAPEALAQALRAVLNADDIHRNRVDEAVKLVEARHLMTAARATIWAELEPMLRNPS